MLASVLHRLKPVLPLDLLLDVSSVANRLAFEKAPDKWADNPFLMKHIKASDRVLEIGSSSGRVLSRIEAAERVGVDTDGPAIERGRKDYPELTLIHGDGRDYLSGYDVLILSHVLEHIAGPGEFLSSLDFDRIYVEVPDFDTDALNHVRLARGRSLVYTDADHVAEFDRDGLEALFAESGLEVIDSEFRWGVMRYWVCRAR